MFGRLLRVTGTVLVIAVAFVTPVLATSAPASADTVVNGCTIVSNPTPTNFTNCPGADLSGANLSGVNLSFANLSGAVFAVCGQQSSINNCNSAMLGGANLTDANLSSATMAACGYPMISADCFDAYFTGATLTGATLNGASFATCFLNDAGNPFCGAANLSQADLSGANLTGVTFGACNTSAPVGAHLHTCAGANLTGATLSGATLTGANLTATSLVPSDQTVAATSPAGAVAAWSTPSSLPGATPGSCSPASGSTFPIGEVFDGTATSVTCQVVDDQGNVATGTFQVSVEVSPPTTAVLIPSNGATVSEGTWLDAGASSPVGIASVTFKVSGGSISDQVVGTGVPTLYGYIGGWDTRDVPNGTYNLQSVATDTTGVSTTSAPITVTVDNGPLSTTVIVAPSSLDPTQGYVLDAVASAGATGVSFQLNEGGGVLATETATDTLYGWIYDQPPTPNSGCAMLTPPQTCSPESLPATIQSVATYPGGTSVTSAAVNTDVVIQCVEPNVGCVPAA